MCEPQNRGHSMTVIIVERMMIRAEELAINHTKDNSRNMSSHFVNVVTMTVKRIRRFCVGHLSFLFYSIRRKEKIC